MICVFCTKDTCENHLCSKCARCSDCCECDLHVYRNRASSTQPVRKNGTDNESHDVPSDKSREHNIDFTQEP